MAPKPLTDEQLRERVGAYYAHGLRGGARVLGLVHSTLQNSLQQARERGLIDYKPVIPGYRLTRITTDAQGSPRSIEQKLEHGETFELPAGHQIKGVSALLDPEGREIIKWIKTREGGGLDIVAALQNAFKDYEGRSKPTTAPKNAAADLLTLIPCADWHVNLLTWNREVGENWDLKIAEKIIGQSIITAISRSPPSEICVVLGGGDLLHADTNENRTARSGNVLDADGRHQKALEVAQRLKVQTIDAALERHKRVIVRILQGNHDEYSSVAITYFLHAWYRNQPRVTVDLDASLFWWHRFGNVFLGATHGHTVKLAKMASIMAHRRAEDWGKSKFRYVHGFHIHHDSKIATEGEGVIAESHQAPIPMDAWAYGAGFLSGRSVKSITYHSNFGEIERARVAILDGGKAHHSGSDPAR